MVLQNRTVLVTGGCGYLGSAIVPQLLAKGYNVNVIDSLFIDGVNYITPYLGQIKFINADLCDESAVKEALAGVDFVIHLAAIVGYPACDGDPVNAIRTNLSGTETLLKHMKPNQGIVYASTGSCYGSNTQEICTEMTPLNPLSIYGITKAMAEEKCVDRGGVGLRLATLFGISHKFRPDLLMHQLTREGMQTGEIQVYEPHFQRTFLHVKDAARAFVMAYEKYDVMGGKIFNVGDDAMNLSKMEMAEEIGKQLPEIKISVDADGEDKDKRNYRVCFKRIGELGFKSTVTVQEGIREVISYYNTYGFNTAGKIIE